MSKRSAEKQTSSSTPSKRMVFLVLATFADTTWRLFVPTLGGTVLGLVLDNTFNTKPWLTAVGVVVGALLAFALVWAQVSSIKKSEKGAK